MWAQADQLCHGAPRLADLSAFPGVVGVAGVIDAETGIVSCKALNVDHALLDDLGASGVWRRCGFRFRLVLRFGRSSPWRAMHAVSLGHLGTQSFLARVRAGAEVDASPRLAFV